MFKKFHNQRKTVSILLYPHVSSDLAPPLVRKNLKKWANPPPCIVRKKLEICQQPLPILFEKIRNWLTPPPLLGGWHQSF